MTEPAAELPENLVDLLNKLIEPPPPDPVAMWPQTWGWAVLAVLGLGLALRCLWRWHRRYRANAYRRAALNELQGLSDAAEIAALLRRTALAGFARRDVAGLSGPDWIAFLSRSGGFPQALGADLLAAPYRAGVTPASDDLRAAARRWIVTHDSTAGAP
ncbi:MAG: DUF4381 domain-containing protein [Marinibacterium sp.]|nr:DUF4381 domain-containing protein [Marinibacterium sp.]